MPKGETRTRLYLVCSPLGGVGKTITARLLLDHALSTTRKACGFDTNHHDPALEHLFPIETTTVDLSSTRGQMMFFDRLVRADGAPKIIDLWHATYDLFWVQAANLGFFREAHAQGIETIVFLQADRRDRFLYELVAMPSHSLDLTTVLVYNKELLKVAGSEAGRQAILDAKRLLVVPEFDAATLRAIEKPGRLANALRPPLGEGRDGQARVPSPEGRDLLARIFEQLTFLDLTMTKAA